MNINAYHAKLFAEELTKPSSSENLDKLAVLPQAQVDLNPHQIEAALFAFRSPLSNEVILADEVVLSNDTSHTRWRVEAGRSHADGDLLLAVVRGSSGTRVFELRGGGGGIGMLKLAGARQDLILSAPEWSGQGETMRGLDIFALSNDGPRKVAGISTVYDDNCASGSFQPVVVADRIFADVDAKGEFRLSNREHWSSPCSPEEHFTLVSKGTESAEDVLVRLGTPEGVPSKEPATVSSPTEDRGVFIAPTNGDKLFFRTIQTVRSAVMRPISSAIF
jgi:hypothetical protein